MPIEILTEVRDRQSVNKRTAQKFDIERFSIKNGNEVEVREEYGLKIKSKFAALHN
jgi:hypothetical protein